MKVKIIVEKNSENQLGRCGFQIENLNKRHLNIYLPNIEKPEANKEDLYIMHSIMKAMIYFNNNLNRVQYILFKLPYLPPVTKEWKIMEDFVTKIATKMSCKIEYTKA